MSAEGGEIYLDERRIAFTVVRSDRRRRTMAFAMDGPEALKITVPARASLSSIRSVLQKHVGWIRRRMAELQKAAVLHPPRGYHDGAGFTYRGYACRLRVTQDKAQPQGCKLLPRRLMINLHSEFGAKDLQEEIRLEIMLWLKKRAKIVFQRRMDLWAARLGVRYRQMMIANAERRWGSCSAKDAIRLNWRLILMPLPVLDYVVVHELCHVRNKNHGPRFWKQVASVVPDYKERRKELRQIEAGLLRSY